MSELFSSIATYTFLQNAVLAAILASIVCGITGTFVVVKKITFISGGIAHTVLGGVGIAYYFGIPPIIGAFVFAILSAIIIGLVKLKANQHENIVISALWAMGMAVGVIFMYLTPGYSADLISYLFGNILMVSSVNLYILAGLNIFIIIIVLIYYRQFVAITYDEEQARLRGLPVDFLYILLLCIIALTIVVLIQIVGIILVIALLSLPAAIAGLYTRTLHAMMFSAIGLGMVFTLSGIAISFTANIPTGATIIIICGLVYLIAINLTRFIHKKI